MWKHGIQQSRQGLKSNNRCQEHEPYRITANLLLSSDGWLQLTPSSCSIWSIGMIPTVENKQQGFKKIKKMRQSDKFMAHLEICVLLQVLHSAVYHKAKRGNLKGLTLASLYGRWFISEALCSCQSQAQVIYNSLKFQYKKHIPVGRHVSFPYVACHFLGNIIIKMSGITASARNIFRFQPISRNSEFKERIIKYCMTN